MADAYERTRERQGFQLNRRTLEMLTVAERSIGFPVTLTQGSYNNTVGPSAGTHDGGGAMDLRARDLTRSQRGTVVQQLRRIGFAAWLRLPTQGPWPIHIHAVAIGDRELSRAAKKQVRAYKKGKNGLRNNIDDDGPRVDWTEYPQTLQEDDVALSNDDKAFLRDLVSGIDKSVKVVGRNASGQQVQDVVTLGGRLLLLQDDTDNIQRRLDLISAAIGRVDDTAITGLTTKLTPLIVSELAKLPAGTAPTKQQVSDAVSTALRDAFGVD
ncbi:MAG: hypothetical protein L0Y54_11395 [Sporichthyaceae bacterium]|nr:hypothetical protein [Sporichthyaceae bacterium]